jgi:hypothetical protein
MFNKIFEEMSLATTSDPDVKSTFDKLSPTGSRTFTKNIPNNKEIREL